MFFCTLHCLLCAKASCPKRLTSDQKPALQLSESKVARSGLLKPWPVVETKDYCNQQTGAANGYVRTVKRTKRNGKEAETAPKIVLLRSRILT